MVTKLRSGFYNYKPLKTCNLLLIVFHFLTLNSLSKSQVFTLKFGLQTIPVYCHMGDFGCGGGGWTPVMKTDGTKVQDGFSDSS